MKRWHVDRSKKGYVYVRDEDGVVICQVFWALDGQRPEIADLIATLPDLVESGA